MIVSIASGKGGTGKTSVAVNMALSVGDVRLLDCDVEEPNAHLFIELKVDQVQPVEVSVPSVNEDLCDHCGKCADFCQYNALFVTPDKVLVFPELCHNCDGCLIVCPKKAISMKQHRIGSVICGKAGDLEIAYGELEVGEPMAVPIIRAVKQHICEDRSTILDSPPGTSCPVVQTVNGSDFCLLVTEPTPFGLHDLKIIVQVLQKMKIPFGVVVNRAGIGNNKVYKYCEKHEIPILLEIPYERRIAELYSKGIPFCLEMPEWKPKFRTLFETIRKLADR